MLLLLLLLPVLLAATNGAYEPLHRVAPHNPSPFGPFRGWAFPCE